MAYYFLLSIIEATVCFSLGLRIYFKNPREALNRIYFVLSVFAAWSAFTEFNYRGSETVEMAVFWYRLNGGALVFSCLLHHTMEFTKHSDDLQKGYWLALIHVPAVVLTICGWRPGLIWVNMEYNWWGWDPVLYQSAFGLAASLWGVCILVICIWLTFHYYQSQTHPLQKRQAFFYLMMVLCLSVGGVITEIILPLLGLRFPPFVNTLYMGGCLFIWYAMTKFDLFALSQMDALESVLSSMAEAFLLTDRLMVIRHANEAFSGLFGYRPPDILGRRIQWLFHDIASDDLELGMDPVDILISPDRIQNLEIIMQRKGGAPLPISVSKNTVTDRGGQTLGYIFFLADLTPLKRTEKARLDAYMQATSDLVAKFTHELRNPMSAILSFTQLLLGGSPGPLAPEQADILKQIAKSGEYLLILISEILEFAKSQADQSIGKFEWFSVWDILDTLQPQVEQINRGHGHKILYEIDQIAPLFSSQVKIHQVLLNLLSNAIKFTPGHGIVIVKIQNRADSGVFFSVKDNGPGISFAQRAKLFLPFSRLQTAISGTGLGLAISRKNVDLLGGELEFFSEVGRGSEFFFTLPMVHPAGKPPPQKP